MPRLIRTHVHVHTFHNVSKCTLSVSFLFVSLSATKYLYDTTIKRAPYTRQLSILVDKSKDPFIARMVFQKFKSHRLWLKLRRKSEVDTVQDSSMLLSPFSVEHGISFFTRALSIFDRCSTINRCLAAIF